MRVYLEKLADECASIFGDGLVCLLLIGSTESGDTTPFSDIDLVGVARKPDNAQMARLREVVRHSERLLDFSFLFQTEIPSDPNKFRMGSHGCYHLELVLKRARSLYGKNIFLNLPSPDPASLRLTVFEKLAEYNWWVRRLFVESNRPRSLSVNYQINSRLVKMARDYLYLLDGSGMTGAACCVVNRLVEVSSIFTEEEKIAIIELARANCISENAGNMSEKYLELRFVIAGKLYDAALALR